MQSEGFSLRPATPDDIPFILEIENKAFPKPWTAAQFAAEIEKPYSKALVLTDDETDSKIAGYLVFWLLDSTCTIQTIAIHPDFRGLGYGEKCVRGAVYLAMRENAKKAILDVRASNTAAIQLYQKCGFFISAKRLKFYENGEDAYTMECQLEEDDIRF